MHTRSLSCHYRLLSLISAPPISDETKSTTKEEKALKDIKAKNIKSKGNATWGQYRCGHSKASHDSYITAVQLPATSDCDAGKGIC